MNGDSRQGVVGAAVDLAGTATLIGGAAYGLDKALMSKTATDMMKKTDGEYDSMFGGVIEKYRDKKTSVKNEMDRMRTELDKIKTEQESKNQKTSDDVVKNKTSQTAGPTTGPKTESNPKTKTAAETIKKNKKPNPNGPKLYDDNNGYGTQIEYKKPPVANTVSESAEQLLLPEGTSTTSGGWGHSNGKIQGPVAPSRPVQGPHVKPGGKNIGRADGVGGVVSQMRGKRQSEIDSLRNKVDDANKVYRRSAQINNQIPKGTNDSVVNAIGQKVEQSKTALNSSLDTLANNKSMRSSKIKAGVAAAKGNAGKTSKLVTKGLRRLLRK